MGPEFNVGKNVDVVGPHGTAPYDPAGSNPFFLGDPDKKQQNEPSCDVSPNNPLVVFCGMNSYSAVDRTDISGEPWVSAGFSMDGGLSWKSHLVGGFKPKDTNAPAPLVTPLGYDTAADPVVRLVPGIGLDTFIAFNRAGNGALLMGRWRVRNSEGGSPYELNNTVEIARAEDPRARQGGSSTSRRLRLSSCCQVRGTYNFVVPDPTPTEPPKTRIEKVLAGVVHRAHAVFPGTASRRGPRSSTQDSPIMGIAGTRRRR